MSGYFINPAAVSARVMTPPTSMPRRFGSCGTGFGWRTGLWDFDHSVAARSDDCRDSVAADRTMLDVRRRLGRFGGWIEPAGEAEKIGDVIGRRNSRFDQERAFRAIGLVIAGEPQRRAVGHVGDGVGFDDGLAVGIPPDLARMAVDVVRRHRRRRQAVNVEPLLDDLVGIAGVHGAIGAAVPHRHFRPRPLVFGGLAHEVAKFVGGTRRRLHHAAERFADIAGNAVRKTGNDGAARKHFRIGGQHHRRHGAAGGKAGDIDATGIDFVIGGHARDHLPDRSGFAATARDIARIEPVEAGVGVVRALLFGHQQRKAIALGERRPAGAEIVSGRGLAAAMQDDDERRRARQLLRHIREHLERAGIGAKSCDFDERALPRPAKQLGHKFQAIEAVQLRKMAQEFDVLRDRQASLLGRVVVNTTQNR